MVGGVGNGMTSVSIMAIICNCKTNRQLYIIYWETLCGLGTMIGPLIGSFLYIMAGYKAPFFVMGTAYLITLFCVIIYSWKHPEHFY